jgi:hypothetical protein
MWPRYLFMQAKVIRSQERRAAKYPWIVQEQESRKGRTMKRTIVIALVVVGLVFGVVAYATAASQTVTVSVTPNAKLTATVTTSTVSFGAMDPGTSSTINSATTLVVSSNKLWSFTKTVNDVSGINLSTSLATVASGSQARGANMSFPDNYTITSLPWTLDGGTAYSASNVVYNVTQP